MRDNNCAKWLNVLKTFFYIVFQFGVLNSIIFIFCGKKKPKFISTRILKNKCTEISLTLLSLTLVLFPYTLFTPSRTRFC